MYHSIIIVNELKDKSSGVSGQSSRPPVLGEQGEISFTRTLSLVHMNPLILQPTIKCMYIHVRVHTHAMIVQNSLGTQAFPDTRN